MMLWGLFPYFAKSASEFKGLSTLNAKAETVLEKPYGVAHSKSVVALYPQTGFMNGRRSSLRRRSRSSTR